MNEKKLYKVGFQGEAGAYSEQAIFEFANYPKNNQFNNLQAISFPTFRDIFIAIERREISLGAIPLENTLGGSIHENYDLLRQFPEVTIVAESQLHVEHNLIVAPHTEFRDIKRVTSHPQALAQCLEFINKNNWEIIPGLDTAGSVKELAKNPNKELGTIASERASEIYGMKILAKDIQTHSYNYTRFAFIQARKENNPISLQDENNKISCVFTINDKLGKLGDILKIFGNNSMNLTKIESRPIQGKPWQYYFYLDTLLLAQEREASLEKVLKEIKPLINEIYIIGCYPSFEKSYT